MILRSADGIINFQCDGLCRSIFDTGLVGGKLTFIRARNAAAQAGWLHRRSADGWVQHCPTCVAESDSTYKAGVRDTAETETTGKGFGLLDDSGNPLTCDISVDVNSIDEIEDPTGALSECDDG